ncbi:MAG: energy transducer TonB [Chloracidobacterium sp.]|nr:energy transducer TonB [Chloracidobacterium sp.]
MFDKLVESAKQKQGRASRLFFITGVVYAVALAALGVAAIISSNSALAEEYDITGRLIPPAPSDPAVQAASREPNRKLAALNNRFIAPIATPPDIGELNRLNLAPERPNIGPVSGGLTGMGPGDGMPGAPDPVEAPAPPPAPAPAPKPTPTQVVRLTSALTQGRVLRRVKPLYPAIARQARVQGQVQVQIGISETGEVTDVILLSGHPLLRDAALQAARQWLFIPTELNGQRVRAIGLLTFNFKLD